MLELNRLYNMDCMEGMRQFPDKYFELAIVDPPYGIGIDGQKESICKNPKHNRKLHKKKDWDNSIPSKEYFKELERVSKNQIIWGVNFYPYSFLTGGRLVWDKKGTAFGRAELAYLSMTKSVDIVEIQWNGMLQDDMKNKELRIHPTQKPVKLYKYLIDKYLINKI